MFKGAYHAAVERATTAWRKYKDKSAMPVDPEPIRAKGQHVSREVFNAVKHSLKLVGRARGYENVKRVADMHNVGRTTAYRIKSSPNYGHFTGNAKQLTVKSSSRAFKIPVHSK